jgi:hypothetical protein
LREKKNVILPSSNNLNIGMTAIVGVLNKHAVAIAADSAITMSGPLGRKVLNRANKIFMLSKYHPIGIMIYNSAALMGVPWDVIIKLYRKQLCEKSFPKLTDYQADFIDFITKKSFFTDSNVHLTYLGSFVRDVVINEIGNEAGRLCGGIRDDNKLDVIEKMKFLMDDFISKILGLEQCESLNGYTIEEFRKYSDPVFEDLLEKLKELSPDANFREKAEKLIFNLLKAENPIVPFTGIVFTGYGDEEIYPELVTINVSLVIDRKLRYYNDRSRAVSITEDNNSAVMPFAQTDVMNTVLSGVDPHLEDIFAINFKKTIMKYGGIIADIVEPVNKSIADSIRGLDISSLINEFTNSNQEIKKKEYIVPLVRAIASLEKEDLIDVAESLISLTSLKRRMTFAEESVGGPVDVAVISKGDGFIWIKRKHYFDPSLNSHFFTNYFK